VRYGAEARSLEPRDGLTVHLVGGQEVRARAVLVATGARRRRLGVPGERELEGRGVSYSATRDREWLAGRDVAIVGGGDSAAENALLLAELGGHVRLVARGALRARAEFRDRLARDARIEVHEHTRVLAILGDARVRAVRVSAPEGESSFACEAVVVKVGVEPNTEWCRDVLAHDAEGYLTVDARLATSVAGVWAAGDVARPLLPSVPVAAGHGALAVAAIRAALRGA
jgi:thioredoxin reductase (NADPH)